MKTTTLRRWTQAEIAECKRLHKEEKIPVREVAEKLGRTFKAVSTILYSKPTIKYTITKTYQQLTNKELEWLDKHFKNTMNVKIAARLGISSSGLHRVARLRGLTKTRQFVKKTQLLAKEAARESHIKNGTYPPKGYAIPNAYRFPKGESLKDRLSPKKFIEVMARSHESWRKTYKRDKARVAFGLEQKTKLRVTTQSKSKINYRYRLLKMGYMLDPEYENTFIVPDEEKRSYQTELHAEEKHKFIFVE